MFFLECFKKFLKLPKIVIKNVSKFFRTFLKFPIFFKISNPLKDENVKQVVIDEALKAVDTNGDGQIDLQEYLNDWHEPVSFTKLYKILQNKLQNLNSQIQMTMNLLNLKQIDLTMNMTGTVMAF